MPNAAPIAAPFVTTRRPLSRRHFLRGAGVALAQVGAEAAKIQRRAGVQRHDVARRARFAAKHALDDRQTLARVSDRERAERCRRDPQRAWIELVMRYLAVI